ncbi:PUA domain-containing protein [Halorarius litoreus]|uniref:PUA domain-containing protein n=1 Tax=Halorarius litoreus TaxID=2962676 RepID=UPI0020CE7D00|nr:PUA domain-containing protein [Halorarius litoreus]
MDAEERQTLSTVADYQFGSGAGVALFPPNENPTVQRTRSGRPTQIHTEADTPGGTPDGAPDGRRIVSYEDDGRFRLGLAGGERLLAALPDPMGRVVVGDESEPFVRDGKNVFAKFVSRVGEEIRPGDEVAVVHERGDLLAVGRAELSASEMRAFDTGMAVKVRNGTGE